jgi:hypothetical protein
VVAGAGVGTGAVAGVGVGTGAIVAAGATGLEAMISRSESSGCVHPRPSEWKVHEQSGPGGWLRELRMLRVARGKWDPVQMGHSAASRTS